MADHEHPERPTGQLIIPAQGFNVARLAGAGKGDEAATYLWTGERWLSGPYAPSPKWYDSPHTIQIKRSVHFLSRTS